MTANRARFETEVQGVWGLWPTTPTMWSYSSLKEIESCPLRWMLSHADYPDIWGRHGYPPLPVVAAIFGNVVHGAAELLAKELNASGITSPRVGDVVGVLSSLGGWRTIVLNVIERELIRLDDNPRVTPERANRLRDKLVQRAPEAADQVKAFLGRGALPTVATSNKHPTTVEPSITHRRYSAGLGAHVEREITAEELRLTGRIDLLTIDDSNVIVTDFKTGMEDEAHDDQLRLYALLWHLDSQTNPKARHVTRLRVAYPSRERVVDIPGADELKELQATTAARVQAADAVTRNPPPAAIPSKEKCRYCPVKHLCAAYWSAVPPAVMEVSTEEWFDFEGRVLRPNGSRSWFLETLAKPTAKVLVRTAEKEVAFPVGKRVRLLGVRRSQDLDAPERLVISMVATSEWYPLSS